MAIHTGKVKQIPLALKTSHCLTETQISDGFKSYTLKITKTRKVLLYIIQNTKCKKNIKNNIVFFTTLI